MCRSVRFDIINLLTNLERHLQCVPGNLSSYEYFLLKTCVLETRLLRTGLQLAQVHLGKNQNLLNKLNQMDLCVIDKIVFCILFAPQGLNM